MLDNEMCPWTSTETQIESYSAIPSLGPGFDYENCDQFTNVSNANQTGQYSVQSPFDLSVQGQEVPQYYSEAYESRVANHSASQRVSVIGKCFFVRFKIFLSFTFWKSVETFCDSTGLILSVIKLFDLDINPYP